MSLEIERINPWDHRVTGADWEYNTDNQNDDVVENLTGDTSLVQASSVVARRALPGNNADPNMGVQRRILATDSPRVDDDESGDQDEHNADVDNDIEDVQDSKTDELVDDVEDLEDDDFTFHDEREDVEKNGEFGPASAPEDFQTGREAEVHGEVGEVTDIAPIHGETYIQVTMEDGKSAYWHWKDIWTYHPSDEELVMEEAPPSITSRLWSRLRGKHAERLFNPGDIAYCGRDRVRVLGMERNGREWWYFVRGANTEAIVPQSQLDREI